jgi:hypothetical protein
LLHVPRRFVREDFLRSRFQSVPRGSGDGLGTGLGHVDATSEVGIDETHVQGGDLRTVQPQLMPQAVGECPGGGLGRTVGPPAAGG